MVPLQNIGSFLNSSFTVQMSSVDRTSTPQYTANGSAWPAKRRRIEVACNVCKSRKSKCDGARPVCSPCLRRKRGRDAGICKYRTDASDDFVNPQRYAEFLLGRQLTIEVAVNHLLFRSRLAKHIPLPSGQSKTRTRPWKSLYPTTTFRSVQRSDLGSHHP